MKTYHLKPFSGALQPATTDDTANTNECVSTPGASGPEPVASSRIETSALVTPPPVDKMARLNFAKGAEWCRLLREARPLQARHSLKEIALMVGTSAPTLSRLLNDFKQVPTDELTPERLAPVKAGGRDCEWEFLLKNEAVKAKLLELYVATMGASSARAANDRRTASAATAFRHFTYEPECPAALIPRLREGYEPVPFVKFLRAAVTPEVEARIRGPKHAQLYGQSARRDWTARLPNGDRCEEPAAHTLSMDDMSINHPFWVEFQGEVILSRQGLYSLFAKHKFWQSVELVARVRESYTAADILRTFAGICRSIGGIPPYVEFEQGIWKARLITGWRRDGEWLVEEPVERPAMSDQDKNWVASGLGLCGVKVDYKRSAHTKHIETHFHPLQRDVAVIARQFQCIGRYAGEFEHTAKQLRRVRAGSHTPSELGFGSQGQIADCIAEAFRRTWEMPSAIPGKTRAEAHWEDMQRGGLMPLSDRLVAACLPGELRKTTVRNGYLNVVCRNVEYQYRREEFAGLGDGYELYYKFDDSDPNLGIAVFNRTSPSNSANFKGWQLGEFMFLAPREIPGPKRDIITAPAGFEVKTVEELYGAGAVDQGDTFLKKQKGKVATQARFAPRPGQIGMRSATARDGRGNVATVSNAPISSDAATPVPPVSRTAAAAPSAPESVLPPRPQTAKPSEIPWSLRKNLQEAAEAAEK